jgi:hypothetical protein
MQSAIIKEKAAEILSREEIAARETRLSEIASQLAAADNRAKDLEHLAALGKEANVNALQAALKPEADAIGKLAAELAKTVLACEKKWRAANSTAHEAMFLAESLGVRSPLPDVIPYASAQRAVASAVAAALVDAGCSIELATNLGSWITPPAAAVTAKLRAKDEDE